MPSHLSLQLSSTQIHIALMLSDRPFQRWNNSDRFRQETLFTSTFIRCQPELNLEQSETISAIDNKWKKVTNGEQLDGTEPSITFEEFAEWGIRYPVG